MAFNLEIVTPEKISFSGLAKKLVIPATDGQLTILSHHAPLFTTLKQGIVILVEDNGKTTTIPIGKGMIEVKQNKVNLLIEPPEHADQVLEAKVLEAEVKAKKFDRSKITPTGSINVKDAYTRSSLDFKNVKRKKKHQGLV